MIDLKVLRDSPDVVRNSQKLRGEDVALVDQLIAADAAARTAITDFETLRAEQNILSKSVGSAKGDEKTALLEKAKELKETFHEFLKSLGVSVSKMINMLSYTFIIPLLGFLVEYTKEGYLTSESSTEIGIRLASFGILTLSSKTLTVLFKKLINRFSS